MYVKWPFWTRGSFIARGFWPLRERSTLQLHTWRALARLLKREFSPFFFCPDSIIFLLGENNIQVINQPPCRDFLFSHHKTYGTRFSSTRKIRWKPSFLFKILLFFGSPYVAVTVESFLFKLSSSFIFIFCFFVFFFFYGWLCNVMHAIHVQFCAAIVKRTTTNWNGLVAVKKKKPLNYCCRLAVAGVAEGERKQCDRGRSLFWCYETNHRRV